MIKDGVALVKFFMWLEKAVAEGVVTEVTVEEKLREFRSQQELFVGESFSTIAGYAGNGAVIHYHAHPDTCLKVKPEGLLLIDSGGQYMDGTTDITRTVAVGKLTRRMGGLYQCAERTYRHCNGHLSKAPEVRNSVSWHARHLWDCQTYWHDTWHGGHFLNVTKVHRHPLGRESHTVEAGDGYIE